MPFFKSYQAATLKGAAACVYGETIEWNKVYLLFSGPYKKPTIEPIKVIALIPPQS